MQNENPKAKYEADKDVDVPVVSSIDVNDDADTIKVNSNGLCVPVAVK